MRDGHNFHTKIRSYIQVVNVGRPAQNERLTLRSLSCLTSQTRQTHSQPTERHSAPDGWKTVQSLILMCVTALCPPECRVYVTADQSRT